MRQNADKCSNCTLLAGVILGILGRHPLILELSMFSCCCSLWAGMLYNYAATRLLFSPRGFGHRETLEETIIASLPDPKK